MHRSLHPRPRPATALAVAVVAAVLAVVAVLPADPAAGADPWAVPVATDDLPDPDLVIADDGRWFTYTTGNGWFGSVPNVVAAVSEDAGATWRVLGDAVPTLGSWAGTGFTWAPSVLPVGDQWVMYYTARDLASDRQCIGRAVADDPAGPFTDPYPAPLVCQSGLGGSIDPDPFVDAAGDPWLLWKSDENPFGGSPRIWSQRLTPDGLGLVGAPVAVLDTDLAWEGPLVENPQLVLVDGVHWLFYSAHRFDSPAYATGVARCAGPAGPCEKAADPLLATGDVIGPGGASVAVDAAGDHWMLHHGWSDDGDRRWLYRRPVTFTADAVTSGSARAVVDGSAGFVDVPADAYYAEAVGWMVAEGITTGTTPSTFSPLDPVTRAQLATFLWRQAGEPPAPGTTAFVDVPADAYYAEAVGWMVAEGITTGTSPSTFSPDEAVSRSQMATFLHRLDGTPPPRGPVPFDDVPTEAWYHDAVTWLAEEGITTGTGAGEFAPADVLDRAQAATLLWRRAGEPAA